MLVSLHLSCRLAHLGHYECALEANREAVDLC